MAVKETPLQQVKRLYGGKDKLVEAVVKALEAVGEDIDDDAKADLSSASNKKLLRLPLIIGNYHSHPESQAEFRDDRRLQERRLLELVGIHLL